MLWYVGGLPERFENSDKHGNYHRVERAYGSCAPLRPVDAEKVAAEYKDGLLTVTMPQGDKRSRGRSRSRHPCSETGSTAAALRKLRFDEITS